MKVNQMTYEEALEYIDSTIQYGSDLGLENIRELLHRVGDPQKKLRFVHLAGTNGKGSTAAYLSTILAESGYKVGRYISPVIFEYRERIQITQKNDGNIATTYIPEEKVTYYLTLLKEAGESMLMDGLHHPTTFEIETAMTFLYLKDEKCQIVVLETGLGGRLDATNVVDTTICSVFTSISMDHMQFLGDTIEKIATEKAGIIKDNIPVVSYDQVDEARKVLEKHAKQHHCTFREADFTKIREIHHKLTGIHFSYKNYEGLHVKLLGENQVMNAVVAIETCEVLNEQGYDITENSIRKGLKETIWPGRFEIINTQPIFVVDGAHNEDAARSLQKSIELYFKGKRLIFIMGVFADKEYEKVIKLTCNYADTIITIETDNQRALSSKKLAEVIGLYHPNVIDGQRISEAIPKAMSLSQEEDVIIAFGSLSFLGEIYRYFNLHS